MLVFAFCSACCSQGRGLCSGWVMSACETFVWFGVGGTEGEEIGVLLCWRWTGGMETCLFIWAHVKVWQLWLQGSLLSFQGPRAIQIRLDLAQILRSVRLTCTQILIK